jgi:hypothetical protein
VTDIFEDSQLFDITLLCQHEFADSIREGRGIGVSTFTGRWRSLGICNDEDDVRIRCDRRRTIKSF